MNLWEPLIQYGFAGFSLILLAMLLWVLKGAQRESKENRDLVVGLMQDNQEILQDTITAINELTAALRESQRHDQQSGQLLRDLLSLARTTHDRLISRPCIATREGQA